MTSSNLRQFTKEEQTAGQKVSDAWKEFFQTQRKDSIDRGREIEDTARVIEAQSDHESTLLAIENVVGVAPSMKMTANKPTQKMSLTILVEKKLPKDKVPKGEMIPPDVDGVPTDVVEVGVVDALAFTARVRPALPGFSIGHYDITAGTFGALVRDIRRCCCKSEKDCCCTSRQECAGDYLILSNNHVLANTNRGKAGDLILQPGPFDGGLFPSDGIATLDRFEPIVFGSSGYNLVDAAVARPTYTRNVTAAIIGVVIPRGINQAAVGGLVVKAGRTTQVTTGRVLATNATIAVNYGVGVAVFRHQILTTAMAAGGDSGSLLMDANLNAVGLLFAGSSQITIFNHISDVETALGVRPVTSP